MQKPNDKDGFEDDKTLFSANLRKKLFLHCLLIPTLGKSGLTLFLMTFQTASVRIWSFCSLHFTTDSFTNKAQFDAGFSKRLKLKDNAVPTILDLTVMPHHTSVSYINCFYYVVTIALSVKQIIWYVLSYLWIFYLNYSSVHLWRT